MMTTAPADASPIAALLSCLVEVQVLSGEGTGKHLCLLDPPLVRIGTSAICDLNFPEQSPFVTQRHAEIQRHEGDYYLVRRDGALLGPTGPLLAALPLPRVAEFTLGAPEGPRCRISITRVMPFGRYLLTGRLGAGGMAEVYAARQTGPGMFSRAVVVKLIRLDLLARQTEAASMFLDEARIAAQIAHPNVVHIYDVGEEAGTVYIAMEHLRGVTLDGLLRLLGPLPWPLAAALMSQACAGLHAAHELRDSAGQPMNVVHRDVSPSNIMCSPEGAIKVIDFGVARAEGRLQAGSGNILKGKPAFMAPEQIRHQSMDRRTDVFAAALVLHELCTGVRIFARQDIMQTLHAVLVGSVPPLRERCPDAPRALEALLLQALAQDPAARPPTAAHFAEALDELVHRDGNFTSQAAIARYLRERGADLRGPAPVPVDQVPALLALLRRAPAPPPPVPPPPVPKAPPPPGPPGPPPGRPAAQTLVLTLSEATDLEQGAPLPAERVGACRLVRPLPPGPWERSWDARGCARARCLGETEQGRPVEVLLYGGPALRALPAAAAARLRLLAEPLRALPPETAPLAPVLEHGVAWEDGPSFLVTPHHGRDLKEALALGLRLPERIALALALCQALRRATEIFPGFVHGNLHPGAVALLGQGEGAARAVLLDPGPRWLLGLDLPPPSERTTIEGGGPPLCPPECVGGADPGPAADVFLIGALIYQLFGGDPEAAGRAAQRGQGPPRLPPRSGMPARIEAAVLAALRRDPDARPDAAALCGLIDPASASAEEEGAFVLQAPGPGTMYRRRPPRGPEIAVYGVELSLLRDREPLPLLRDAPPGLLPAPLRVSLCAGSLMVELAREDLPAAPRPGIYHDAHQPVTRCEAYPIAARAAGGFDVGHRRAWVQRVTYKSTASEGADERLAIELPELGLRVLSAGPARRLCALHLLEPRTGVVHLLCVTVLSR